MRTRCIASFVFVFAFAVLVLGASFAGAQAEAGMYPYSVFNKKPLPIGTAVWVNIGDTECAYGQNYPSARDECFREYRKAKIVKVFTMHFPGVREYVYRVRFEPWVDPKDWFEFEWNAGFDDLYEAYNLPERWAKYSRYFLALNW